MKRTSNKPAAKVAVIYKSVTGHSKKLAEAIANKFEVKAEDVKEKPFLFDVDLLFVVGGIYSGHSKRILIKFLKTLNITNVKRAALITSSASLKDKQYDVRGVLASNGIEVLLDEFECRGGFLLYKMHHPKPDAIEAAVAFAEEQVMKISKK